MLSRYDVRTLPENGEVLEETLGRAELEQLFEGLGPSTFGLSPIGEGQVRIELRPISGGFTNLPPVRIRGRAAAPVHLDCVRCLAPLERRLEAELDLTLFPAPIEAEDRAAGPEAPRGKGRPDRIELSERELDEGQYRGFELDLPDLIREGLLLEVEMNPVCADEAACQARVQALATDAGNPQDQAAEPEGMDPRWAPLRKFRLKSS